LAQGCAHAKFSSKLSKNRNKMAERYLIPTDAAAAPASVPESLKKKIARNTKLTNEKNAAIAAKKKSDSEGRRKLKIRTLGYDKEYARTERKLVALRREAKKNNNFFVEPEPKLLFVIRIHGINKIAPKPRKIMQLLRLRQISNGVFLKVNTPILNMLKCVNPYITYGFPSLKTVRALVYKRGFAKVNKNRIPLSDNEIISEKLGKYGIHGIEDIVHELYTAGPNFKAVSNFLWPFKLSSPRGGYVYKRHGYGEPKGGDWGPRQEEINELISRMN